jgi:hypothetical protein
MYQMFLPTLLTTITNQLSSKTDEEIDVFINKIKSIVATLEGEEEVKTDVTTQE